MDKQRYEARRERLRISMARAGLDAMLVTHPANRFYLSGFELHDGQCGESSGCLLISRDGKDRLCTDSRYEQAALALWDKDKVHIYGQASGLEMGTLLRGLIPDRTGGRLGFESRTLSWGFVRHMSQALPMEPADGLVEDLRVIKDAGEMALLEESMRLNHDMFAWLPSALTADSSEADIAWNLEKFFRERGASELSFPPIVGKDGHAALPHYSPLDNPALITPDCHVLVDAGARFKGYCSDQTRTFWVGGKASDRFLKVLDLVQQAQKLAIDAIRPGVSGREVHGVAMAYFDKHGVAGHFTHSLGHGVGLEVHEEPRLSSRAAAGLKPGMVVTVEPGLYFPEWGGVRWEHVVAVTEDGHRIL